MDQDRLVTADDLIRGGCCRSGVRKALLREYERGRAAAAAMPAHAVAALTSSTERDMVKQALHIDGFGDGVGDGDGSGSGYSDGYGYGYSYGYGDGDGHGHGYCYGYCYADGDGDGYGYGDGDGDGSGSGDGDGY